jgi:hypothetical protein
MEVQMRRFILVAASLTSAIALEPKDALAQRYKSPNYNGCIRQYYEEESHWLAFENTCSEPLYVLYIPFNPGYGYGGGSMDIGAGRHSSTGQSRREVDEKRGFELYVCPEGYFPVDANDRLVERVNTRFRCKQE